MYNNENTGVDLLLPPNSTLIDTEFALSGSLSRLLSSASLALDIEMYTDIHDFSDDECRAVCTDPRRAKVRLLTLMDDQDHVYFIDTQRVPVQALSLLFPTGVTIYTHYGAFDLRTLGYHGLPVGQLDTIIDTHTLSAVLHKGKTYHGLAWDHDLASVLKRELGITLDKTEQSADWSGPLTSEKLTYDYHDVAHLPALAEILKCGFSKAQMREIREVECGVTPVLVRMERQGMVVDVDRWDSLLEEVAASRDEQRAHLDMLTGEEVD
jgi:ribonuclease D